jgi:hypothetical protein
MVVPDVPVAGLVTAGGELAHAPEVTTTGSSQAITLAADLARIWHDFTTPREEACAASL